MSTFEIMWAIRKTIMTMPVTAIATFFPTVVAHSAKRRFIDRSDDRLNRADCLSRLVQRGALVGAQRNVDDYFQACLAKQARHTAVDIGQAEFALQPRGAWQHALPVEHDRFRHLHSGRARRVIRRPGLEMCDDLRAAVARAI